MKAILTGITALFSAATLVAQQPPQSTHGQNPSGAACPQTSATSQGHMMPGMQSGSMDMSRGHMMPGAMEQSPGGAMPMGGMAMGDMGMMSTALAEVMHEAMLFAPSRILGQAEALKLSDSQRQQIEQLKTDLAAKRGTLAQPQQQLQRLLFAESPDPAAVRSAAHTAFGHLATVHADQVSATVAVRAILTSAQREEVRQQACATGGMMPGMNRSR